MQTSTTPAPSSGVSGLEDHGVTDDAGFDAEPAPSSPVFVDTSGRRRKNWRRLTIVVVAALCGYICLVALGFAGGPIPPAALLPLPGVPGTTPAGVTSPAVKTSAPASASADTSHIATSQTAKDTTRFLGQTASHGGLMTTSAAGSPRPTAAKPTTPLPSSTPSPSGTTVPTTPSGTTVPTPSSTTSSTHGPAVTPPSHSHSK